MRTWIRLLPIATLALLACVAGAADPRPVLLSPDKVWTGDGAPHAGWSVLVAQGRIQGVGPAATRRCSRAPYTTSSTPTRCR